MTDLNDISELEQEFLSDSRERTSQACDRLVKIGGQRVIDFFIAVLNHDNPRFRDSAALGLYDLRANQAVEPLLKAVNEPTNANHQGTMAYALEALDCSNRLNEIFDLLLYGNLEVKMAAATILEEQSFNFSLLDLKLI